MFWPLWAFGHNFVQNRPIALILISFDSARRALLNELSYVYSNFFTPKMSLVPLWFFDFQGPISRPTDISTHREWYRWFTSSRRIEWYMFQIEILSPVRYTISMVSKEKKLRLDITSNTNMFYTKYGKLELIFRFILSNRHGYNNIKNKYIHTIH